MRITRPNDRVNFRAMCFVTLGYLIVIMSIGSIKHTTNELNLATTQSTTQQYVATITTKDSHHNTKTFNDYCNAKSNSEAETIFKERYAGATISGVRESK
jgi:hypothetical protein